MLVSSEIPVIVPVICVEQVLVLNQKAWPHVAGIGVHSVTLMLAENAFQRLHLLVNSKSPLPQLSGCYFSAISQPLKISLEKILNWRSV